MKDIKILGVDIAKDVFQLCGIDDTRDGLSVLSMYPP